MSEGDSLRRDLGLAAVVAIVVGDILGSGIFYTPGELAAVAQTDAQVYFLWTLCGAIVLCGALTVAELSVILPRAGATYHMIREGWGPFWGFLKIWMEMWVSGPGAVAGVAILFGTFVSQLFGARSFLSPALYGAAAIAGFAAINLLGVRWGGRTQVVLTAAKVTALLVLVAGALLADRSPASVSTMDAGWSAFFRFMSLGVASVLFTYDGWIDITHVSGEVRDPEKNITRGLVLGVIFIILVYGVTNFAFLKLVPLDEMRSVPDRMATLAAQRALGSGGSRFLVGLMTVSIFGALGGLVMTLPRLFYAGAVDFRKQAGGSRSLSLFYGGLSKVSGRTAVPTGSIVFCAVLSIVALLFFQSFSRIVNFFVVSAQTANILAVSAIFRLPRCSSYRTPGYPLVPAVFVGVMVILLIGVVVYHPFDSLIGIALTATGTPVYFWLNKQKTP